MSAEPKGGGDGLELEESPLDILDGGHLLFFIIEGITGKPLPDSWQNFLLRGGIAFLLSLMLFVTIYDILRGINN